MTRMAIDSAEVRRIARLAHLDLDEATIEAFTDQLQSILDYVAVLEELDLHTATGLLGILIIGIDLAHELEHEEPTRVLQHPTHLAHRQGEDRLA